MSFGCQDCTSQTLNTAIHNALTAGVTIVAAAGNDAKDVSTFSPANNPDVIAVSAVADTDGQCGAKGGPGDDMFAGFSNYGPTIDLAAPGVNIHTTNKGGLYSSATGTSMAAPHVAGAAALYKSENPGASPSQVLGALKNEGSIPSTVCDPESKNGKGYFSGDKDSTHEPLLHIKSVVSPSQTTLPTTPNPSNNATTSGSGSDSGSGTPTISGNATGIGNTTGTGSSGSNNNNTSTIPNNNNNNNTDNNGNATTAQPDDNSTNLANNSTSTGTGGNATSNLNSDYTR